MKSQRGRTVPGSAIFFILALAKASTGCSRRVVSG
jgi:hypothetical protein